MWKTGACNTELVLQSIIEVQVQGAIIMIRQSVAHSRKKKS